MVSERVALWEVSEMEGGLGFSQFMRSGFGSHDCIKDIILGHFEEKNMKNVTAELMVPICT